MNKLLISAFIATFLVSTSVAFAAGVEVSVSKISLIGYTTEDQNVDIAIKNTESKADTFTVTLLPTPLGKISASLSSFLVSLNPDEEKTVKLTTSIPIDAEIGSIELPVKIQSTSDQSVVDTKSIILTVKRLTSVYVSSLTLDKYSLNPGDETEIKARVFNLDDIRSEKYILKIIVSKGNNLVKTFAENLDSIGARSSVDVSEKFTLDRYAAPGSYVVDTELRDASNHLMHLKSVNFNVNTVTQPNTEYTKKSTGYDILFSKVTIQVKNDGNVNLPAFSVTESIPKFAQSLFEPDVEPLTVDSSTSRIVYTWSVPELAPGGQYTVVYKLAIWRIWLTFGIIIGAGYAAYRWLSKPRIEKLTRHQGEIVKGKEIIVMLEIKNRALHEIKDVEVVDAVPQIARVVDKFDTLRPSAKRVPGGIELRWNLSSMKPGEERILTYRIRPVVDVIGHLNLPVAQMTFLDRSKIKRVSASKQALVKAGQG